MTAVVQGEASLTYADLEAAVGRYCSVIPQAEHGEQTVALYGPRSADLIVALLGVMLSGGAYVPLDPRAPASRLLSIIADARPTATISHRLDWRQTPILAEQHRVISAIGFPPVATDLTGPSLPDPRHIRPQQLAYVIYTSGTTGVPKGVAIEHSQLAHSTEARIRYYGGGPGRVLMIPHICFDSSVAVLFWALTCGGTLFVPRDDEVRDVFSLLKLIDNERIETLLTVPSHYRALLRAATGELEQLKTVIVAGESCSPDVVAAHFTQTPVTRLFNEYGPTEATVWATVDELTNRHYDTVPIGLPVVPGTVRLLGNDLRPVPAGEVGEIYICGPGVARGYVNSPGLTASRFLPDPNASDGSRMFATRDLARITSSGEFRFCGRRDRQVKLRGLRVELDEIDAVLGRAPGVTEAAVTVTGASTSERLVAAVVLEDASKLSAVEAHLQTLLPEYMLPRLLPVRQLPRSTSGKIDGPSLARLVAERNRGAVERGQPCNVKERVALAALTTVARGDPVGLESDIRALSLDSLDIAELAAEVQSHGFTLDPSSLSTAVTVREFARRLRQQRPRTRGPTASAPVLPAQAKALTLAPINVANWATWRTYRLGEELSPDVAVAKIMGLGECYQALRALVSPTGETQHAAQESSVRVETRRTCAATWDEQMGLARGFGEELVTQLDPVTGPVLAARVLTASRLPTAAVIAVHQLAGDMSTWRLLERGLAGDGSQSTTETIGALDWAVRLSTYSSSRQARRDALAWSRALERRRPSPLHHVFRLDYGKQTFAAAQQETRRLTRRATDRWLAALRERRIRPAAAALAAVAHVGAASELPLLDLDVLTQGRPYWGGVQLATTAGRLSDYAPVSVPRGATMRETCTNATHALAGAQRAAVTLGALETAPSVELPTCAKVPASFNYFGAVPGKRADGQVREFVLDASGESVAPEARRPYDLEIDVGIIDGCLDVTWSFPRRDCPFATGECPPQRQIELMCDLAASPELAEGA